MLDAKFIRDNPDAIRTAMSARGSAWDTDEFLALDERRRELIAQTEALQARRNELSRSIGTLLKDHHTQAVADAKAEVALIKDSLTVLDADRDRLDTQTHELLSTAPNLPDASVPLGVDEHDNVEVKRWGTPRDFSAEGFEPKAHWDLGPALGIIDFERAVKLAESRFVLLGGAGAQLERALINFMLDLHADAGFKEWWPPTLANAQTLYGTGQLPKFADDLYQTVTTSDANEGMESGGEATTAGRLYLTPTAEVTLTNIHRGEVLNADSLPRHYTAYTACFREEAGSAGRDTRGMIRIHQFDKVELVKLTTPETSFNELESMTCQGEKVLEILGLPYRRLALCTGDLGFGAAKTYDLEVWLPSYNDYKEISSCSNCVDFQARRAGIKYRDPDAFKGSRYLHTLNGSALALSRTFAAIIENYQNPDGTVTVPEALRPYLRGLKTITK
ncbi:MAG: serine--tRNA ligase [Actinomycetes bacterium]|jgi:seryl-tRNA synthetase|nr:serine--tRNA ligase [Actinomycetes bacterium]